MTNVTTQTTETTATVAKTETPKYLVQRAKRTRYSFGDVWLNAVLAGVVTDRPKLEAHGVKVNAGTAAELAELSFDDLLARVQTAIFAEPAPQAEVEAPAAEAPVETEVVAETEELVAA